MQETGPNSVIFERWYHIISRQNQWLCWVRHTRNNWHPVTAEARLTRLAMGRLQLVVVLQIESV